MDGSVGGWEYVNASILRGFVMMTMHWLSCCDSLSHFSVMIAVCTISSHSKSREQKQLTPLRQHHAVKFAADKSPKQQVGEFRVGRVRDLQDLAQVAQAREDGIAAGQMGLQHEQVGPEAKQVWR